ncbi:16S rRNA (uracil(1498)-N(3))-methyltransferase [Dictyobacter arantiisoli]|uniref:Ribosomal RNA small subunit methyltransferase E n=1 Tax=Dictyobacter arantiisoli TaxID=2014874 RepID=A0A5A5TGM5_9CHLR|nr:16S rRNA (uracil(1498)-N(3))-methyltransferase [Dictyobacter arantiisoli]GCF10179.1 ribosomal RNA small subunit methyltransferase E [Dictyobacter arantiisoli]
MHRFFIGETGSLSISPGETLALPEKLAHQVHAVLHFNVGEQLILFDNSGTEYVCSVTQSSRSGIDVQVNEQRIGKREPALRVILCQGLLKSARFEFILEKGTELGVTTFVPTLCQRSLSGLEEAGPKKRQRWERIMQEATEQCGRSRVPELQAIQPLARILQELPSRTLAIMPWEEEEGQSLHQILQTLRTDWIPPTDHEPYTVMIFIGPEGGLTAEEVALAKEHGVQIVSLGSRILRAETAALATVANVIYDLEALILGTV